MSAAVPSGHRSSPQWIIWAVQVRQWIIWAVQVRVCFAISFTALCPCLVLSVIPSVPALCYRSSPLSLICAIGHLLCPCSVLSAIQFLNHVNHGAVPQSYGAFIWFENISHWDLPAVYNVGMVKRCGGSTWRPILEATDNANKKLEGLQ